MTPFDRVRKKRWEAERLAAFSPEATLLAGFHLIEFARVLRGAVDDADRR